MSDTADAIRSYWNIDASTYDLSPDHRPRTATELAAWSAALRHLLPAPPARVLDAGAGTGFLTLLLARQGYAVTAVDFAPQMLARLRERVAGADLDVEVVEGDAATPPDGPFDAVVERHLLWTLPDPARALDQWRRVAPRGRLVLIESEWGTATSERLRANLQSALRRLRQEPPNHHAEYDPALRAALPFGAGANPEALVDLVERSAWGPARIERLRDVEWATRRVLSSLVDQLIGTKARFAIVAG